MERVNIKYLKMAEEAKAHFSNNLHHLTYTDGEIEDGDLLAVYWNPYSIIVLGVDEPMRVELDDAMPGRVLIEDRAASVDNQCLLQLTVSEAAWLRDAVECTDTKPGADNVVKLDIMGALTRFLDGEDE